MKNSILLSLSNVPKLSADWKDLLGLGSTENATEENDEFKILGVNMSGEDLHNLIKTILIILIAGFGVAVVGIFAYGSIMWSTAGDDEEKVKTAQKIAKNGLIGIGIFVGFIILLFFMAGVLGINITDAIYNILDEVLA